MDPASSGTVGSGSGHPQRDETERPVIAGDAVGDSVRRRAVRASAARKPKIGRWILAAVIVAGIGAAAYYYRGHREPPSQSVAAPPTTATATPPAATEPRPPAVATTEPPAPSPAQEAPLPLGSAEALPAADQSDRLLSNLLAHQLGEGLFGRLFYTTEIVHRIVVTVDNLPRPHLARRLAPVKPAEGPFRVSAGGGGPVIARENATRYDPYVRALDALDLKALVTAYARFYPWFQKEYQDLGYPSGSFNDRLIEVINHLLDTPVVEGPIRVVQPKVLFQFADADLESRSAGQKILLRVGPENAARIKAKLRELLDLVQRLGRTPPESAKQR